MKRTKYKPHKPLLSGESIRGLEKFTLDGHLILTWIFLRTDPMTITVDIWVFTKRNSENEYLDRAINVIVNKVLNENPDLKLAKVELEPLRGYYSGDIHFKKKPIWERLFSKKISHNPSVGDFKMLNHQTKIKLGRKLV